MDVHPRSAAVETLCGPRYRIVNSIASGGMADVFEGEDSVLGRRVAIKILKAVKDPKGEAGSGGHLLSTEAAHAADRMRVEARSLALVSHPNVVAVIDFGTTADGRPFLVTERLVGRTLGAELRARGCFPHGEAVDVALAVLAALEAAHAKGIVHRDVKPGNIFLCDPPSPAAPRTVKLLDFGVAKILGEASVRHVAPAYRTKKGALVGTPKYITPEQAFGRPVDARTDVYAVGLVLYAMVAGRIAFAEAGDLVELIDHMRAGASPPSTHCPHAIPAALDRVVLKALAWSTEERFPSAAAFAEALRGAEGVAGRLAHSPRTEDRLTPVDEPEEPTRVLPEHRDERPAPGLSRPVLVVAILVCAALVLAFLVLLTQAPGSGAG